MLVLDGPVDSGLVAAVNSETRPSSFSSSLMVEVLGFASFGTF